jgi:uncharacterized protein
MDRRHSPRNLLWFAGTVMTLTPTAVYFFVSYQQLKSRDHYVLASGRRGGLYFDLGEILSKALNEGFQKPDYVKNVETDGSTQNIDYVENGVAQLAFTIDGLAPSTKIRALAKLYDSPLHIVIRRDSNVKGVADLSDKILFLGPPESGTRTISEQILKYYGFEEGKNYKVVPGDGGWTEAKHELNDKQIEAAFFLIGLNSSVMNDIATDGHYDLLPIDRAPGIVASRPVLDQTMIEPGSYPSSSPFPSKPVQTIASREILVCSDSLSEGEAYRVVSVLDSASGKLIREFPMLSQTSTVDPEKGYFYELHQGAVKFYRNRQEPGFSTIGLLGALAASLSIFGTLQVLRRYLLARFFQTKLMEFKEGESENEDSQNLLIHIRRSFALRKISKDDFEALKELAVMRGISPLKPTETATDDGAQVNRAIPIRPVGASFEQPPGSQKA